MAARQTPLARVFDASEPVGFPGAPVILCQRGDCQPRAPVALEASSMVGLGVLASTLEAPRLVVHAHDVLLGNWAVEQALHVAVGSEALADVADAAVLGVDLHGLEPKHVVRVEEHVPYRADALVDLERRPGEHDPLGHNPPRLHVQERPGSDELRRWSFVCRPDFGGHSWRRRHLHGREHRRDGRGPRLEKPLELVCPPLAVSGARVAGAGGKDRPHSVAPERAVQHQGILGLDDVRLYGAAVVVVIGRRPHDGEVEHGHLVFVAFQLEQWIHSRRRVGRFWRRLTAASGRAELASSAVK
ncbi:MAG: hypothetical protein BJ554DRAFT_5346 [Olpidium bornovanus]|uniref:Uncharacterized protein n=1 Tax=Olpidium bornovanus TaxID=278681 RepID=A0A8H8DKX6_9FUNG|nr:MAG: hypothetical protein BJ554DRAFT_5346 [Olpidium bornovanus]